MLDWLESPAAPAALPRRAEQERAAPRPRPGRLHLQAGAHRRPRPGSAAVPRFGAEPGDRRHRLLELDLHRRRRRAHARQGGAVPDALLAHTSPLTWEHIGFSGDFLWDRAAATAGRRRPLNLSPRPDGSVIRVPSPFDLSVVCVTADAMPSTSRVQLRPPTEGLDLPPRTTPRRPRRNPGQSGGSGPSGPRPTTGMRGRVHGCLRVREGEVSMSGRPSS